MGRHVNSELEPGVDTTWGTHPADERVCEALSSRRPYMRTTENHQKSSRINDLENEPGHVWRLPEVSGVTSDQATQQTKGFSTNKGQMLLDKQRLFVE